VLVAESSGLLLTERDGDLLRVTLNDPRRANALSPALLEELTEVYSRPLREEGIRALILSASGKHFSAGADLAHLASLQSASYDDNLEDSKKLRGLFEAVLRQETLTVALVQGACVAGGCGLATAHDFVIAAEGSKYLYSEVRIGFVAALVATYLPLRVRGSHAREMLLNPQFMDADRALEIGLVNRVSAADELAQAGDLLVDEILRSGSSESIARTKRLLLDVVGAPLDEALHKATLANAEARGTADCQHGIATFLEKKSTPNWRESHDEGGS